MKAIIEELTNLEDFKNVYKVFSGSPYNEKYTDEELKEIFEEYKQKGFVYGAYNEEECIGLIALERGKKTGQPVNFEGEEVMYLADVAVLENYRRRGLGNQLMLYGVIQAKLLGYDKLYMRTLAKGSMSYGIAKSIGFTQIPNAFQNVKRERIDGSFESMRNIFLEIDLNSLDRDKLEQVINSIDPAKNKVQKEIESK